MADRYERPGLVQIKAEELRLSRHMLPELMRAVLAKGKPFRFSARGYSMVPFIRDEDIITVMPLGQVKPGVGDIVAFIRPNKLNLVVHRVLARLETTVLVQGDNREGNLDEVIPYENLIGRVTRIERGGQNIRLGLGPERYMIAWLSRVRLLVPLSIRLALLLKPFSRR